MPPPAMRSIRIARRWSSQGRIRIEDCVLGIADTKAVFFDVDFTLIYPGPTFRGEGYREFCLRYGMEVDASKFAQAVAAAAPLLDRPEDAPYEDEIFIVYTRRII